MQIILIRHAERERAADSALDPQMPLTPEGRNQAAALADRCARLGFRPSVYLASRYAHAVETAEIMRNRLGGREVTAIGALTPHQPYTLAMVFREAEQHGHNLSELETVAWVLQHPRVYQLLGMLTSQAIDREQLGPAGMVIVTADSLGDLLAGKGQEQHLV